jgi:hypothetical protein
MADSPRILAFSTQGSGGNDEQRLRELLTNFRVEYFPFDRAAKRDSFAKLRRALQTCDLAVMEGTGIAGGLALLMSGKAFVVSSGDSVAPFVASKQPLLAPLFTIYEKRLCRRSSGFIGWTPYLAGRALTYGAPRAMTAAGWSPHQGPGRSLRAELGIPAEALVIGIVGAIEWNARAGYCYGWELARAVERISRKNVVALIVGGGSGLERVSGDHVIRTGAVPRAQIPDYLATMDIASLPQSCDQLGSFRYSTKLAEYLAARLPVVTGQLPMAYDLDCGWMWRLPGRAPWDPAYIGALAELLERVTDADIDARRAAIPVNPPEFDRDGQVRRVTNLINDILSTL